MGRAAKWKVGSAGLLVPVITANDNDVDRGVKGFEAPIVARACVLAGSQQQRPDKSWIIRQWLPPAN
jgi:hypothetical protein